MATYTPLSNASDMEHAMDAVTADVNRIPGAVAVVVDKHGNTIFQHASGKRGADTIEPMTLESWFWMASCTKIVGSIAVMQLVEQGILSLDDADQVERLALELKTVRILTGFDSAGRPELVAKRNRITLRMLLTHTAGFGYTAFNEKTNLYTRPQGNNEMDGSASSVLTLPLLFEPGTDWCYGVSLDWAGVLLERATHLRLNDYLQLHVFAPLHLHHITMFPNPVQRAQLAHMNQKLPGSKIHTTDHPYRAPLTVPLSDSAHTSIHHSPGAGLFARPTDYVQILSVLLNEGLHTPTNTRILQPETVKEMFTNQIPGMPDFGRTPITSQKPIFTNDIPELYPQVGAQGEKLPQGWGISFMMTAEQKQGGTGRNGGTGWWAGLPNLFWWADPGTGVAGLVASQVLPFAGKL